MERLSSNDLVVLGVSKDSEKSHKNFIEKQSLNFSLLLDEDLELHNKYGVWREKSMYGKNTWELQDQHSLLVLMGKLNSQSIMLNLRVTLIY